MILYIFTTDGLHTEKGAEFTLEIKFKNRERCYKILSTLSDNLNKLLFSEKDEDIVKSAYSEWFDKYEEFLLSHDDGCLKVNKFLMKKVSKER